MTNNNTSSSAENVSKTLYTPLCDLLHIRYPIIQAGMAGGFTTPELIAAVSNAGALGVLGASRLTPEQTRNQIRRIKTLTNQPFGVNSVNITRFNVAKVERYFFLFIYQTTTFPYSLRLLEIFHYLHVIFTAPFRSGAGPRGFDSCM
jgi:hypothetical protein